MTDEMTKAMEDAFKWLEQDADRRAKCLSMAVTALEQIANGGQALALKDIATGTLIEIATIATTLK